MDGFLLEQVLEQLSGQSPVFSKGVFTVPLHCSTVGALACFFVLYFGKEDFIV